MIQISMRNHSGSTAQQGDGSDTGMVAGESDAVKILTRGAKTKRRVEMMTLTMVATQSCPLFAATQ